MSEDEIPTEVIEEKEEKVEPIKVILEKEETKPEPNFDYDDYLPTPEEIQETEKEIDDAAEKRKVKNA